MMCRSSIVWIVSVLLVVPGLLHVPLPLPSDCSIKTTTSATAIGLLALLAIGRLTLLAMLAPSGPRVWASGRPAGGSLSIRLVNPPLVRRAPLLLLRVASRNKLRQR